MSSRHPAPDTREPAPAATERLAGVDIARALAVFGMFTVHIGVGGIGLLDQEGAAEVVHQSARGRSSALFAFLAGLSLALMSGRSVPSTGAERRRVRGRVIVRAVLLVLLGGLLEILDTPVAVILAYYGGFFVLALPLLRLRAASLAGVAAAVAFLGPQISYALRAVTGLGEDARGLGETFPAPFGGVIDFLFTGYYPAATFMGFVVAGMAVGRLDLRATGVRLWLAASGAGLALLGYGGSWMALHVMGGIDRIAAAELAGYYGPGAPTMADMGPSEADAMREWVLERADSLHGEVPATTPAWLTVASPHSGTTFEILGAVGTALVVLVACLALADIAGKALFPPAAAGAMALSVYVGHIVVLAIIDAGPQDTAPFRLEYFVIGALACATAWRLTLGRGPLERVMGRAADAGGRAAAGEATPVRH